MKFMMEKIITGKFDICYKFMFVLYMFVNATGIFDLGKYQLTFSYLYSNIKRNMIIFDFDVKENVLLFSY